MKEVGAPTHIWCGGPCWLLLLFNNWNIIYISEYFIECPGKFCVYNNNSHQHVTTNKNKFFVSCMAIKKTATVVDGGFII